SIYRENSTIDRCARLVRVDLSEVVDANARKIDRFRTRRSAGAGSRRHRGCQRLSAVQVSVPQMATAPPIHMTLTGPRTVVGNYGPYDRHHVAVRRQGRTRGRIRGVVRGRGRVDGDES